MTFRAAVLVLTIFFLTGCTGTGRSNYSSHTVILYSGGEEVRRWTTAGAVRGPFHRDHFDFRDKTTGRRIRISGTVAVIQE